MKKRKNIFTLIVIIVSFITMVSLIVIGLIKNKDEEIVSFKTSILSNIRLKVNNKTYSIALYDTEAAAEFLKKLSEDDIIIEAKEYGGFEKYGSLGYSLTQNDMPITTKAGDIMLYEGDKISLFYDTNTASYTKIGYITFFNEEELKETLGSGDVTLTFYNEPLYHLYS